MDYKLTVGLEIHAELNTRTKMFCDSRNDADEVRPNVNICPVCLGYPGTLPTINREAVRSVLRLGVAVGGKLAEYSEFDRKNYFYPDIPKGYQISQYKHPLVKGGKLMGIALTRIHLEEDTAKSLHNDQAQTHDQYSLLDFNRAGVPLVELVTEPVIHDAETAAKFAKEFQLLLTYLGIAHANMEKGEMRLEANISVSKDDKMGTKVEVKNLNSFRSVERAIRFEFERQRTTLDRGETIVRETRGWNETKNETVSQRKKEESHDYRYFPEPDLPKLFIKEIPDFAPEALRRA
ncbi:MAG: Asp-tRNA(Asn)/Glu-tRNA(Gln) amidotransferase subunit GatB, partial [Patescibacteria group bacterium]